MSEIELKFALTPEGLARLRRHRALRGRPRTTRLCATYFDTPDHVLRAHHLALRVRREGAVWVQTLKGVRREGDLERTEHEAPAPGGVLDLRSLPKLPDGAETALTPMFQVDVVRSSWVHRSAAATVEISLDEGAILAGGSREPVREVELELKAGTVAGLFSLARTIAARPGAILSLESKSGRGYRMIGAQQFADEACSAKDGTAGDLIPLAVGDALKTISAAAARLARTRQPAAVHDLRIALRRTRTMFQGVRTVLRPAAAARMNVELKWLAGELDQARELDVLIDKLTRAGGLAVSANLEGMREAGYAKALRAIDSQRFERVRLDLMRWSARPPWRSFPAQAASLRDVVGKRLSSLDSKIRKRAGKLRALSAEDRHHLRIRIKQVRYLADLFGGAFGRQKRLRRFGKAAKALQDILGELNDGVAARPILEQALATAQPEIALQAGRLLGMWEAAAVQKLSDAETALRDYAKVKRFW